MHSMMRVGARGEVASGGGAGGSLAVRRVRAMAPGEWTSGGKPAVRAVIRWVADTPWASHCAARSSRAAHSAAESIMRGSAVPSAARAA
ncbi:hypothetical protein CP973_35875 [Streptomyces albofaciens JCM 4342]|nr:hypothetical protein CP973_35875 [Streptomyces albofaciens JCM 4342]